MLGKDLQGLLPVIGREGDVGDARPVEERSRGVLPQDKHEVEGRDEVRQAGQRWEQFGGAIAGRDYVVENENERLVGVGGRQKMLQLHGDAAEAVAPP